MSDHDNDQRLLAAEMPLVLKRAVDNIGKTKGTRLPLVNDPVTQAAQEYFIASEVCRHAEKRKEAAKLGLINKVHVPKQLGTHVVVNSPHATALAKVSKGQTRLNEGALLKALSIDFFNGNVEQAAEYLNTKGKVTGDPTVTITVSVNDVREEGN